MNKFAITAPRESLLSAVRPCAELAAGCKAQLSHIKLFADGQQITVTGSDGELWITRTIPCAVQQPGTICPSAKTLFAFLADLDEGDISLKPRDAGTASLSARSFAWTLPLLEERSYPEPPAPNAATRTLDFLFADFKRAAKGVIAAASKETHRPALVGMEVSADPDAPGKFWLVATDSHRLHARAVPGSASSQLGSVILPSKLTEAIIALPLGDGDRLTIHLQAQSASIEVPGASLSCPLVAGSYPDWRRVVPRDSSRAWIVQGAELKDAARRLGAFSKQNANRVTLDGNGLFLMVSAEASDVGSAKDEVAFESHNGAVKTAMNNGFLQQAIDHVSPDKRLRIRLTEPGRAVLLEDPDNPEIFAVIMPMAEK